MSGFKLIIGIVTFIIIAFLWIVFNESFVDMSIIFNNMTADAAVIERNMIAVQIFYYSLFFMFIAIAIYILKSSLDEEEARARI